MMWHIFVSGNIWNGITDSSLTCFCIFKPRLCSSSILAATADSSFSFRWKIKRSKLERWNDVSRLYSLSLYHTHIHHGVIQLIQVQCQLNSMEAIVVLQTPFKSWKVNCFVKWIFDFESYIVQPRPTFFRLSQTAKTYCCLTWKLCASSVLFRSSSATASRLQRRSPSSFLFDFSSSFRAYGNVW